MYVVHLDKIAEKSVKSTAIELEESEDAKKDRHYEMGSFTYG